MSLPLSERYETACQSPIVLGVLGIIFGGIGMSRAGALGGAGKGLAVTGLTLGIITVIWKLTPGLNVL